MKFDLKIMIHERVPSKMSVTSNERNYKNSAPIWNSPKWIDFKHEKKSYGRTQHEKSAT